MLSEDENKTAMRKEVAYLLVFKAKTQGNHTNNIINRVYYLIIVIIIPKVLDLL